MGRMPLLTCTDCGRSVSDAAPACPQCGRPAPKPAQPKPKRPPMYVILATVFAASVAVWFGATSSLSSPKPPPAVPERAKRIQIGDVGTLYGSSADAHAYLFAERSAYDEFIKAVIAKDLTGANLALTQAVVASAGTSAREIDSDVWHDAIRVRVEDGPNAGFAGWTSAASFQTAQ